MPKLTNCSLQAQRVAVEIGSHMAKVDLLTLSSPLPFIICLSTPAPLSAAFSTLLPTVSPNVLILHVNLSGVLKMEKDGF